MFDSPPRHRKEGWLPARGESALGGSPHMHYVYILYSEKSNKLYKGSTSDLKNRLAEHNRRKVKSTVSGIPWKIIYYQGFLNKTDALREELFLKSGKGRERIKYLLQETIKDINNQ